MEIKVTMVTPPPPPKPLPSRVIIDCPYEIALRLKVVLGALRPSEVVMKAHCSGTEAVEFEKLYYALTATLNDR